MFLSIDVVVIAATYFFTMISFTGALIGTGATTGANTWDTIGTGFWDMIGLLYTMGVVGVITIYYLARTKPLSVVGLNAGSTTYFLLKQHHLQQ